MDQEALHQIAAQLSHPSGSKGIEIGEVMNDSNIGMTRATIQNLHLRDHEVLLEIGHGNCGHLPYVFTQAPGLTYHGLELSRTMHEEALRKNQELMQGVPAFFHHYSGLPLPFPDAHFDKLMTVNTLYFMKDPVHFLGEVCRVLRPGGTAVVTFAHKQFMQQLPFVTDIFRLYDHEDFMKITSDVRMQLTQLKDDTDITTTKTGELVTRPFCMAILRRRENE